MQSNQETLVMKFGGTSVGSADAMAQVVQIALEARKSWSKVILVTSALSGVTNLLLDSASQAVNGDTQTYTQAVFNLRQKHFEIADQLITNLARRDQVKQEINHLISEFSNLCHAISVLGEASPRALDAVAALGERMSVRLLAAATESAGQPAQFVEASQLIVTDRQFQSAHPIMEASREKMRAVLNPILDEGAIAVVTGFIAATEDGIITTLGRGGSDYSAALVGALLPSQEVWIWTDVDGVMTADPRLVPDAHTIPTLSYREVAELAYYGAKVLHPLTIRPVVEAGVGLRVLNTFNPANPGTEIVRDMQTDSGKVIKAVTAIKGLRLITVDGRGMLGVPGVAARTFGTVAATGISVPLISQASSEQSICFAVPAESADEVVAALQNTFAREIERRDIDRIWATHNVGTITVVGAGMSSTPGVAGKVFSALGSNQVNVIAIAQGSSEVSISLMVTEEEIKRAVVTLHSLIA
ncbi:aspartate kinase [Ornatilinea apprima]|uniref:Aspartokinase n=1 Tax=Ornatilinea apprima TaxID=1134406 RepID=A0A0P6XN05_9CHLR|nr:aspartate kinase [Ornatilinea apprima]KPL77821.1 aspartate kinase [Ornatilinea apprima]